MKTQTYLRFSLLFPYILWVILLGISVVYSSVAIDDEPSGTVQFISAVIGFYTIGILIWGMPYSILAIALWVWGRGKTAERTAKVFIFSPLIMTILVAIEIVVVSVFTSDGVSSDFGASVVFVSLLSLPFGYAIIGIVAGIYKLLQLGNIIHPENETLPAQVN
jgi:hypothetical protein